MKIRATFILTVAILSSFTHAKEFIVAEYELPPCTTVEWREVKTSPFTTIRQPELKVQKQIAAVNLVIEGNNVGNPEFDEALRTCGNQTASQLSLVGTTANAPEIQRAYAELFRQCLARRSKSIDLQSIYYKTISRCQ